MAVSGIKSGMPQGLWDTTLLLYKDEGLWKQYLAVSTAKEAYVVLLGGNNRVCWLGDGPYTDAAYAGLKMELLRCAHSARDTQARRPGGPPDQERGAFKLAGGWPHGKIRQPRPGTAAKDPFGMNRG